jgi:hypothetical protein
MAWQALRLDLSIRTTLFAQRKTPLIPGRDSGVNG